MPKMWSRLAALLERRFGLVSVIGLLVTVGLGLGLLQLNFATGQDSYLNKTDKVYEENKAYQKLFGGNAMVTLIEMDKGYKVDDLFTTEGVKQFEAFTAKLEANSKQVKNVVTPLTVLQFTYALARSDDGNALNSVTGKGLTAALGTVSDADRPARTSDSLETLGRFNATPKGDVAYDNPEWVQFLLRDNEGKIRSAQELVFRSDTSAQIITRLPGNLSIDDEGAAAKFVENAAAELKLPHAKLITTGAPVLLRDINDYLRGGMMTLSGIALAIMALILLVLFDVRWRLLPLAVVLVGVTWAFGLAGWLGIPLTVVTIAGLPVMLGVGIDYAIQMHARVDEEISEGRAEDAIDETARSLGPALLVVTFDAVFAFLALLFAKVPMIRQFGVLLAIGIAVICLCSIVFPMGALSLRERRKATERREYRAGWLGGLVVRLGSLPAVLALPLAVVSIGVFAAGIAVESDLKIETDPVRWVNQDTQVIKDIKALEKHLGGANELAISVTSDRDIRSNDDALAYLNAFELHFQSNKRVAADNSLVGIMRRVFAVPGTADVVPRSQDITAAYSVAPKGIRESTFTADGRAANIIYLTSKGSLEGQAKLVSEIRQWVKENPPPAGLKVTPSGLVVVGVGLISNLESNRIMLTYVSIGLVGLFLAFRLRSLVRSLLSLVPVLIAVGLASVLAWVFGWHLSPMTAVGGPLVVAACTEFTSLILLRFVEERQRGYSPREAMDMASMRTGRAFIVSGLTAIAGVAVLSFSSLPLLRDFGRIVAMNVAVALLSALVVLPPMLVFADGGKRRWVSRGLSRAHDDIVHVTVPDASVDTTVLAAPAIPHQV